MRIINNIITLERLRIYAYHGVNPQERLVGAYFYIDLEVETDFSIAIQNDKLEYTISYADIYEIIKEEMATPSQLLEHVAGRIINKLFTSFPTIERIRISLSKENPPMGAECLQAGIKVEAIR